MSVYNGMPYVKEAVDSILNQTFKDFTFLIINDGSDDGTNEYLQKINDGRVSILNQKNSGLGAALNNGLATIKTKYVARMDADDIAFPERLERQLSYLETHSDIGMLGCRFAFMLDKDTYGVSPPLPSSHEKIFLIMQKGGHSIAHPTIMFRMDVANEVGFYRINGNGQDWDFLIRMGEAAQLANLNSILHLFRLHPSREEYKLRFKRIAGQEYAISCYNRRRTGLQEPAFHDFLVNWNKRPFYKRLISIFKTISAVYYRSYVVAKLQKRPCRSLFNLVITCIFNPLKVLLRIKKIFYH